MRTTPFVLAACSALAFIACKPSIPENFVTIGFDLHEEQIDSTDMTTHEVALIVTNKNREEIAHVELGRIAGCSQHEIPEDGPLLTLKCWWAGAGDDFQVRMEGTDVLAIDHRSVEEESAIPEFETVERVTIPAGVAVIPVIEDDQE